MIFLSGVTAVTGQQPLLVYNEKTRGSFSQGQLSVLGKDPSLHNAKIFVRPKSSPKPYQRLFTAATTPWQEPGGMVQLSTSALLNRFSQQHAEQLPASPAIRKDLYTENFGFFCRKELQIEKSTRIPLRIRLGSLEQCNILEDK